MKRIIWMVLVAITICDACKDSNSGSYVINGELSLDTQNVVYLVRRVGDRKDTIGSAIVRDGCFEIEGKVEDVESAMLVIGNKRIPVLLQEGDFEIDVNPFKIDQNLSFKRGGEEQMLLNRYWALCAGFKEEENVIREEYRKALSVDDMALLETSEEKLKNHNRERQEAENDMIRQYTDSYFATYLLYERRDDMLSLEDLEFRYNLLSSKAKEYDLAEVVKAVIDNSKNVQVGSVVPDFILTTPEGKPFELKDLKGKVKVIDFWASWCGPCRAENPNMVRLYQDYKDAGLNILSISLDHQKDMWLAAIKADGMPWNHASDLQGWKSTVAKKYVVNGVPHIIVLDEDNRVVAVNIRGEELREKVKELLFR